MRFFIIVTIYDLREQNTDTRTLKWTHQFSVILRIKQRWTHVFIQTCHLTVYWLKCNVWNTSASSVSACALRIEYCTRLNVIDFENGAVAHDDLLLSDSNVLKSSSFVHRKNTRQRQQRKTIKWQRIWTQYMVDCKQERPLSQMAIVLAHVRYHFQTPNNSEMRVKFFFILSCCACFEGVLNRSCKVKVNHFFLLKSRQLLL